MLTRILLLSAVLIEMSPAILGADESHDQREENAAWCNEGAALYVNIDDHFPIRSDGMRPRDMAKFDGLADRVLGFENALVKALQQQGFNLWQDSDRVDATVMVSIERHSYLSEGFKFFYIKKRFTKIHVEIQVVAGYDPGSALRLDWGTEVCPAPCLWRSKWGYGWPPKFNPLRRAEEIAKKLWEGRDSFCSRIPE